MQCPSNRGPEILVHRSPLRPSHRRELSKGRCYRRVVSQGSPEVFGVFSPTPTERPSLPRSYRSPVPPLWRSGVRLKGQFYRADSDFPFGISRQCKVAELWRRVSDTSVIRATSRRDPVADHSSRLPDTRLNYSWVCRRMSPTHDPGVRNG